MGGVMMGLRVSTHHDVEIVWVRLPMGVGLSTPCSQ